MNVFALDIDALKASSPEQREDILALFSSSLRHYGCFYLKNSFIDPKLLLQLRMTSLDFFYRPLGYKKKLSPPQKEIFRGYSALSKESLSKTIGKNDSFDLNESFQIGPEKLPPASDHFISSYQYHPNIWPEDFDEFKAAWNEYYSAMEKITVDLLHLFSLVFNIDQNELLEMNEHHTARLRGRFYPKINSEELSQNFRISPHTDYGTFSILYNTQNSYGLQIFSRDEKEWIDVEYIEDHFFINIGDLIEFITSGVYKAPIHRVLAPKINSIQNTDRLSLIYFHGFRYDSIIEPHPHFRNDQSDKYPLTTVEEHLRKKLLLASYK